MGLVFGDNIWVVINKVRNFWVIFLVILGIFVFKLLGVCGWDNLVSKVLYC